MSSDEIEDQTDASDSEPAEWLAVGRSKRSNAGSRMQAMLSMEEAQDEQVDEEEAQVNALFMEDNEEPDEEFEDKDAEDEDEGDDSSSSSDEEEQGQDELAGEKQLQREERDRQKSLKRKADSKFIRPRHPVKRARIDEQGLRQSHEGTPDPSAKRKKKSSRVSWVLKDDEGSVRASSRTLAVQNKERTRQSLKESEAKHAKQVASQVANREKKQAESKAPLTQDDRLREAAQVERQNAKSLNRWQELEEERLKRQKQKIEALQSRRIEGPFVRWWSGSAVWVGEKLVRVGRPKPIEEKEMSEDEKAQKKPRKRKDDATTPPAIETSRPTTPLASSAAHTRPIPSGLPLSFLDGIEQYASQSDQVPPMTSGTPLQAPPQPQTQQITQLSPTNFPAQTPLQQFLGGSSQPPMPAALMIPPPPPPPPVTALRSMLSLENFDPLIKRSTEAQRRVVFGLKSLEEGNPLKQPTPELCAVTAQRARYRDPLTGMPYRGMAEFKRLRNLPGLQEIPDEYARKRRARWSNVLEAWVGTKESARGVPESFITGFAPQQEKPKEDDVTVKNEGEAATAA